MDAIHVPVNLRRARSCLVALMSLFLVACTTSGADPYEGFNRKMSSFNTGVDAVIFKPAAQGYRAVVPDQGRRLIFNFFSNLSDPWTAINQLLQGRLQSAGSDTGRFLVNSTVGIGGLFDVGTKIGLPKHQEDFGQTLGVWGVPQGPYIVLPLLGPSSGRGLISQYMGNFGGDIANPILYVDHVPTRNSLFFSLLVTMRARQLDQPQLPPQADRYVLLRDFYMRGREQQVQQ